jgi:predicted RNase H-like HicB family nuclease
MQITKQKFTVIIEKEDNGYVSLCPELDIASQGDSIEEAKENLKEAIELFLEYASPSEIETRLKSEIFTLTPPPLPQARGVLSKTTTRLATTDEERLYIFKLRTNKSNLI